MDIVKAIGIISIVMGHCCYSIMIPALNVSVGEFVYSYHLMVFFFVAGFFYKRGYHEHPEQYIGKQAFEAWRYAVFFIIPCLRCYITHWCRSK